MQLRFAPFLVGVLLVGTVNTHGRDWFVRAGLAGAGTREKPFKDPYLAMEEAGPGDTIHVAQGVYHGKFKAANWVISIPNLTWLGGYNSDFTLRDPWRFPSELRFAKDYVGKNSGTLIHGSGSHENFMLDGFLLDQKEHNEYGEEPQGSLSSGGSDPIIILWDSGAWIRNCLVLNGAKGGLELSGDGCRIENNLVMNMDGAPLLSFRSREGRPAVVQGNTFLFCWNAEGVGQGGTPAGRGVSFWSSDQDYEIIDNIFLGCDGWAVDARTADKLTLKGNVFWLNGASHVKVQSGNESLRVDNSNLSDLEDAGLKACSGNVALNPELAGLDAPWLEKYLDRTAEFYPNATLEELNELRRSAGLPQIAEKKARDRLRHAMAYDAALALKIVPARLKQGSHPVALEVKPFAAPPPVVVYQYEPATWKQLAENPKSLDGKRVEIQGALGKEGSTFPFPGIGEDQYLAFQFHDVEEQFGPPPIVYFLKGSKAERARRNLRSWDGNGSPLEKHVVRGLAKYDAGASIRRKGTLLIEAIETITESVPPVNKVRPAGRDWFVRAGANGRGSREEPFKDPWQALEAAQPGDAIHVAEGEYFGKLKSGTWKIPAPNLSLLGGYNRNFTERDPWQHPSRLGFSRGSSSSSSDPYITCDADQAGFVFDGFVLDGRDVNRMEEDGNLAARFPERELMVLSAPDTVVRNCVLLNSAGAAIQASGDNTVIENNLILNCNYYALDISHTVTEHPFVVRNNTILFTWYGSRDETPSSGGTAIVTFQGTRLELDNNIIGYADGQAVRNTEPKKLKITNNVFTHNRYANFTDLDKIVVEDRNMDVLQEVGFSSATGNVVLDPRMSFDAPWWDGYSRKEGPVFFARPYDWRKALDLQPRNPQCRAGARPVKLEVRFQP